MAPSNRGFTLVELVIALLVGILLTSIALSSYQGARAGYALQGSRSAFLTLHARARAGAIERGTRARLYVDAGADTVAVVRNDTVMASVHFQDVYGVDLGAANTPLVLCLGPRGYADEACTSFTTAQTVTFSRGGSRASLEMLPLGQLVY
jgi:prepilin-type N-terminal cleavage/methylation domain-containing protein